MRFEFEICIYISYLKHLESIGENHFENRVVFN